MTYRKLQEVFYILELYFRSYNKNFKKKTTLCLHPSLLPQDQRQEVPVPVCWLEKKAELPEP